MSEQTENQASAMVVKNGELLAVLKDGVLMTAELHCDEMAVVWYSLLAQVH